MRVIVVGGTDTEIGKTVVTAALAAQAAAKSLRVAVVKVAQTGIAEGAEGDLNEVRRLSGVDDLHELARFEAPLAPLTAARLARREPLSLEGVAESIEGLDDRDLVLVEGSGGLLVHLGATGFTLVDLARRLRSPVLLVARAGLGTLNHSALSTEALERRRVECLGLVIGSWPDTPDLAAEANLTDLPAYCGKPILGRVPAGAGKLQPERFRALAPEWIRTGVL